jgi:hypothetical protein
MCFLVVPAPVAVGAPTALTLKTVVGACPLAVGPVFATANVSVTGKGPAFCQRCKERSTCVRAGYFGSAPATSAAPSALPTPSQTPSRSPTSSPGASRSAGVCHSRSLILHPHVSIINANFTCSYDASSQCSCFSSRNP